MLVQRKHIAYTDSSYSTIYWQGLVDADVQCGESYNASWTPRDAKYYWKVQYIYTDLPVGSVITFRRIHFESLTYTVAGIYQALSLQNIVYI